MSHLITSGIVLIGLFVTGQGPDGRPSRPPAPRIEAVVPLPRQPIEDANGLIWYDDFDGEPKEYVEQEGEVDLSESLGGSGGALKCFYEEGSQGVGNRKVFFGDSPAHRGRAVRQGESFDEIYWRIYVKHQPGWTGAPAKMSRATSMTSPSWSQAMIAHVWSGPGDSLTLDPVRLVEGDRVRSTRYNDWDAMRWLGNRPASEFPVHATEESGWWIAIESRAKLNTPGKSDGINQLWIDGELACDRRDLDFRGSYTGHGINAVFLEAYWNDGSPVTQSRWYDHFVIATEPIGPVVCPQAPTLMKSQSDDPGRAVSWEVQIARGLDGQDVVFESTRVAGSDQLTVGSESGRFLGSLEGADRLASDEIYSCRVRQRIDDGEWSDWSPWHQRFRTTAD